MAKINHNNAFETIDKVIENAKKQNTIHLYAQDKALNGSSLLINGNKLWHFATTGYLGLEQDIRLKDAAASAIYKYGTQFPLSKTYISHPLYLELEHKMQLIYKESVIIAKNSTLAHMAAIPHAIDDNDVVILDHQVHYSVQQACQMLKNRGIPVGIIRHNNMQQLEDLLNKFKGKHQKIWYMADGIYSMYGDHAPIIELKELMTKYPCLHLYFDDVHGMSWMGENGSGFIKSYWEVLPQNMILISTLSKTFGASGAIIICGDKKIQQKIKNFGGPLTFSAQLEPASVAAAIASADIHLSYEIYELQVELINKIDTFKNLLTDFELPLISHSNTPVFYIGTGQPETAYNLVQRLQKDGFFVNPGIYPAVPLKNAGLRITISAHNDIAQIKELADSLALHFGRALEDTNNTRSSIDKVFGLKNKVNHQALKNDLFDLSVFSSVREIEKELWNRLLGSSNALDYDGICFVEDYFSNLESDNANFMQFKYFLVTDKKGNTVALTHTSWALWKEDMLAIEQISSKIEDIRKNNPLFLTSKALSTGSTFTEGKHVFTESMSTDSDRNTLYTFLLNSIEREFDLKGADKLVLRDFSKGHDLGAIALNKGYLIAEMPQTAVFSNFEFTDIDDFDTILTKRSKRHFKEEVLPFVDKYAITVKEELTVDELQLAYSLYLNVKGRNLAVNNFTYDFSMFEGINKNINWDFLIAKDKDCGKTIGVVFCFINQTGNSYNPMLIGMEELEDNRLCLYRQLLFHTIIQAKKRKFQKVFLGISAVFEKRKLGANIYSKEAYISVKDNYATDILENYR
ncbi:aminotransferase class I/II-fold pyridoxal phosphate-dependent enzyme [Flavobacterium sp. JP2137]|uniref:aminotransferase class I/II-fold pyridoxal phosphate-dependent enzyme n=1 Tax=Flavobacterium sp. JP2137 TaxID=3414510 RepID=UPI003D2FFDFD